MKITSVLPPHCVALVSRRSLYSIDGAVFHVDGTSNDAPRTAPYRYLLFRDDAPDVAHARTLGFIMLNPSTADHLADDPTVRRCRGYALEWEYRRLIVGNAYAFRATDPKVMKAAEDPVGPHNDHFLAAMLEECDQVVVAWGKHADPERVAAIYDLFVRSGIEATCLGTNKDGSPKHPLYVRKDARLERWRP